jgi:hypothetical protein
LIIIDNPSKWVGKYFCQVLNVHGVDDNKHTDMQIAEQLVSEPSVFEVGLAVEKLKSHKAELIKKNSP